MSKEKQILHMLLDGYSQRRIASTLCVSRNTVAKVAKAASDHQLSKDALESMEEMEIHNTLFPEEALLPTLVTPDFPYIHKELLKSGVTLKLLWQEYVDTCRDAVSVGRFSPFRVGLKTPISVNLKSPMHHVCY